MPERMAGFIFGNRRVFRLRLALVAEFGIRPAVRRVAVIGVHGMAGGAARGTIIARLLIGAEEPEMRIVQARLGDIDHRHRDAAAGAGAAIGLLDIRAAGLIKLLQRAARIRQTDFRELRADHAAATLEHAENIAGRHRLPGRQRRECRQDTHCRHVLIHRHRIFERGRFARGGIGLAEDVALVGQDAVVVRGATEEHGG